MAMKRVFLLLFPLILVAVVALAATASFSFYQESLPQAFMDVSNAFNVPIIVDNTVSGEVTLSLNNVTLQQAVNELCVKAGLFYFEKDGVYFVGTTSSSVMMKVYGYSTHVIVLKYISSKDVMSFLTPYESYLTYATGSDFLLFRGPSDVYAKVLKTVEKVDKAPNVSYLVYTLYSVPDDFYTSGSYTGWFGKLVNSKEFSSVDAKQFMKVENWFTTEENGFALVQSGKTVNFNLSSMRSKLSVSMLSQSASRSKLSLSLQGSGVINSKIKTVVTIANKQVLLADLRNGKEDFLIELSVVKTAPRLSEFAKLWHVKKKSEGFYLRVNISTSGVFNILTRYKLFSLNVSKISSSASTLEVYGGMAGKLAENFWGYVLLGSDFPVESMNSYKAIFSLVQTRDLNSFVVPSGVLSVSVPILALNELTFEYSGTLELRFSSLLVGVNVSYLYENFTSIQKLAPFLTVGVLLKNAFLQGMYDPFSRESKFELEWGM